MAKINRAEWRHIAPKGTFLRIWDRQAHPSIIGLPTSLLAWLFKDRGQACHSGVSAIAVEALMNCFG